MRFWSIPTLHRQITQRMNCGCLAFSAYSAGTCMWEHASARYRVVVSQLQPWDSSHGPPSSLPPCRVASQQMGIGDDALQSCIS
jgi:hypothetical protein